MTNQEFSNAMDVRLNSHSLKQAFGDAAAIGDINLDEHEKSVFLTQAQENVVLRNFDASVTGQGMDDSARRQIDFSSLISTAVLAKSSSQEGVFDDRGILYDMPLGKDASGRAMAGTTDVLLILNEKVTTSAGNYVVVPINYQEYDREMSKAYSEPLKRQMWRLFNNTARGFDYKSELIPRWDLLQTETITSYKVRYIRRPRPIVLISFKDIDNPLSINGYSEETSCELNPILHNDILEEAIRLVLLSRGRVANNNQ